MKKLVIEKVFSVFDLRFEFEFFMASLVMLFYFQKLVKRKLERTLWMATTHLIVIFYFILLPK